MGDAGSGGDADGYDDGGGGGGQMRSGDIMEPCFDTPYNYETDV